MENKKAILFNNCRLRAKNKNGEEIDLGDAIRIYDLHIHNSDVVIDYGNKRVIFNSLEAK